MNRVNVIISIVVILILSLSLFTTTGFAQEYLPLDLGTPTTNQLSAGKTFQWYAVPISSPGELAVTLHCEGSLTATLYLYYGTSTLNVDASGTSQTRRVERKDLYSGTYYVHVYRTGGEGAYTLEATHTPTPYAQDAEPIKDASDALLIPIDQTTEGLLGYLMDYQVDVQDWYKVTTTVPGSLTIDIQGEESIKFSAYLYDTNSSTSLSSDSSGNLSSRQLVRHDLLPGTYYVSLYRDAGYGGYTVHPVFTPQTFTSDQEPNDAADSAQTINENDSVDGLLGFYTSGKNDVWDWYKVTTTVPGSLTIDIKGEESLKFQAHLYDTNRSSSLHSDSSGTRSSRFLQRSDLEAGTYYISLYRDGGYGGYTLETEHSVQPLQRDAEPNDSIQTAASLEVNQLQTGQLGYYVNSKTDTYDYYQVELSEYTNLRILIKADDTLYHEAFLYDSNGSSSLHSDSSGSKSVRELQRTDLRPGTYYIQLYRTGGYGGYTITALAESYPIQPQARPAASAKEAPSLSLNLPQANLLGFPSAGATDTYSWYSFSVDKEGPLLVHVVTEDPLRLQLRIFDQNSSASKGYDESGQLLARLISLPKVQPGTYTAELYRTTNSGTYSILATDRESGTMANPTAYDFGDIQVESAARAMTFAVINLNDTPIQVQSVQLSGPGADSFNVISDSLVDQTIAARGHGLIQVVFAPDSVGGKTAALIIVAGEETLTVPLEGTGYMNFPGEPVAAPEGTGPSLYAWTDKPVYLPREPIQVTLSNLPGNMQDWIAISPKDSPDSQYSVGEYTYGVREGAITLNGLSEGIYELRTYFNWPSGGFEVQSRHEFVVSQEPELLPDTPQSDPEPAGTQQPSTQPEIPTSESTQRPVAPPQDVQIMQWAVSAEAGSQYSPDRWSSMQSTGEPNTYPDYGDIDRAWAPSYRDSGIEWLELTYATPVYPTRIEVYETCGPGAMVQVEVGSPDGTWYTVWTGAASPAEEKARIVTYDTDLQVLVDKVRLTLDTAKVPGWNEIDAVALVGAERE